MKSQKTYFYLVLLLLLVNSFFIMTFNQEIDRFKILGMNLYNFTAVVSFPIAGIILILLLNREKVIINKIYLILLLVYIIYQVIVILPLTLEVYPGLKNNTYLSNLSIRLSFLLIPFFYWFLIKFKNFNKVYIIFIIFTILLFIINLYNYSQGIYTVTNTGDVRMISGMSAIFFIVVLTNSLKIFGGSKNNFVLAILCIVGVILTNHRSVFLTIGLLFILSLLMGKKEQQFKTGQIVALITLFLILFGLFQIQAFSDIFMSRAQTTFDTNDANYMDRYYKNLLAYETFLDNPINGTLLSGYYYHLGAVSEIDTWAPHNFILDILASQGTVGFLFIMSFLIVVLRIGFKNRHDAFTKKAFFILLFYIFIALANASFLTSATVVILMLFIAMILARNQKLKTDLNEKFIEI